MSEHHLLLGHLHKRGERRAVRCKKKKKWVKRPSGVYSNLPENRQHLSNPFLDRGFGDEAVDHDLFVLTNSMGSAEGLHEK